LCDVFCFLMYFIASVYAGLSGLSNLFVYPGLTAWAMRDWQEYKLSLKQ
jgi:hypothetical protein